MDDDDWECQHDRTLESGEPCPDCWPHTHKQWRDEQHQMWLNHMEFLAYRHALIERAADTSNED